MAPGSASPLQNTRRSPAPPAARGSVTNSDSIDGTKCAVVMDFSVMIRARYAGSRCPSGAAITRRAPSCSGQKNSHTDTSKVAGVFCRTASVWSSGYSACIHRNRLTIAAWVTPTPFGLPVEPEVKMT
ncbi:hypothetical protein GCM10011610_01920 [Nocardia rhizosphaerihabitans]|uniref:Uncharacterized protein n=1 Tax=Nocardia rhizosphaerihabitans TaxID=1691570 RepID=A0ABQ2K5P1_9NOCA|nr:hypothetical protein GCM10011610_01920 [Nocardia rhizosphaerihabitans]